MKLNGKELSDKEELALHLRDIKRLKKVVKTADYRTGANAIDELKFIYTKVYHLRAKIETKELTELLYKTRNNKDYDKIQRKINKLKVFIKR